MHHKAHDSHKTHGGPRPVWIPGGPATLHLAVVGLGLMAAPAAHAQGITLTFDQAGVRFSGGIVERAQDDSNAINGSPGTSFCLGYSFTVDSPVAVTALGFYDDNNTAIDYNTGLPAGNTAMTQSHAVGIFDASGDLLVQATVTKTDTAYDAYNDAPGSTGDGYQLVRYGTGLKDGQTGLVSLPSFVLVPGQTYSIAGVTGSDYYSYLSDPFSAASGINYVQDQYYAAGSNGNTTTLRAPNQSYGGGDGYGFFGPDFRFTATTVAGAPEPSEWAALGFTGLGVGGLLLKARGRLSAGAKRQAAGLTMPDEKSA